MEKILKDNEKNAHIFVVYINEAHPTDGWQVEANKKENILVKQPSTMEERRSAATLMWKMFKSPPPLLIDGMDNQTAKNYSAWPDRIYIIDANGKIAYKGDPGPGGFKPSEAAKVLEKLTTR